MRKSLATLVYHDGTMGNKNFSVRQNCPPPVTKPYQGAKKMSPMNGDVC